MPKRLYGLVNELGITVPLKESDIYTTVKGFIANVECRLIYRNDTAYPVQTSFIFPLDDMSAMYKFEAVISGRHIVAKCQEKEEARHAYDQAIARGQTAMLLAEDDTASDIFECKLGNLPAWETALLNMSYVVELSVEPGGALRFILPTVLNPRYFPESGCSGNKPSSEEIQIQHPWGLKFNASIYGRHYRIKSVTSSKDRLNVNYNDYRTTASISLAGNFQFDHDFSFDIMYDDIKKPEVIVEMGDPSLDGLLKEDILMVNFIPQFRTKQNVSENKREFIFVLDRSGSMYGERIKKSRETLLFLLKSLPIDCLFNIVSFGSQHKFLFKRSVEYNEETLKEALQLQKYMNADMGGTEILKPLKEIYKEKAKRAYQRQIFLLTDGEVGNTNEVISLVQQNAKTTRVFTFGIGEGVSTSLIKGVAKSSNGKATFIKDKDNMQAKVMSILKWSMEDCLCDTKIEWHLPPDIRITNIPTQPPNVFRGEKLVLFGLLNIHDKERAVLGSVTLKGTLAGKPVSYTVEIDGYMTSHQDLPLHRMAAKYQIKELELSEGADSNKYLIVLVSKAANVVSRYTAFIGIDTENRLPYVMNYSDEIPITSQTTAWYVPRTFDSSDQRLRIRRHQPMPPPPASQGGQRPPMQYLPPTPPPPGKRPSATAPTPPYVTLSHGPQPPPPPPPPTTLANNPPGRAPQQQYISSQQGPPPPPPQNLGQLSFGPPPPPPPSINFGLRVQSDFGPQPPPSVKFGQRSFGTPTSECHSVSSQDPLEQSLMGRIQGALQCRKTSTDSSSSSNEDELMEIVSLQNFDGSWFPSNELEEILWIEGKQLENDEFSKAVWCTAFVILYLRKNFASRREEWEMIEAKAMQWLTSQLEKQGKSIEKLFEKIKL